MKAVLPTLAVLVGLVALPGQGQEKAADGRREIRGLIDQLGDAKRWGRAAARLRQLGEKAVEPMVEAITEDGVEKNPRTLRILEILEDMGPDAKEAYGPLADAVPQSDPEMFLVLWHTLGTLVPFTEAQGNRNEAQRLLQGAINTLSAMPAADRRQWSVEYQRFSQRALVDPSRGLKAMIDEVSGNATHRREVAAVVLQRMGKDAKPAIPALVNGLRLAMKRKSAKPIVRDRRVARTSLVQTLQKDEFPERAARALIAIAPGDPRCAIAYGWQVSESPRPNERARAALQIGSFGVTAKEEVPTLIAALGDADTRVRWEVITALGMLGPIAKAAIPKLQALAAGDDKAAAARATAALKQIRRK